MIIIQYIFKYSIKKAEAAQILAGLYALLQFKIKRPAKIKRSANNLNMKNMNHVLTNNSYIEFYEVYIDRFFKDCISN